MQHDPVIEHYTAERVANPNPAGPHPWQVHYTVWNAVIGACRRHGTVGPFLERPITDNPDVNDIDDWPLGAGPEGSDYWVIDDWWNTERYVYLELPNPAAFTAQWLRDVMNALRPFPGWGVGIMAFEKPYILAFADKLMVTGSIFEKCSDLECVVRQGQAALSKSRRTRHAR